jgi:hypothetical protein
VVLAPVDEPCVEAERHVVEKQPVGGSPDVDLPLVTVEGAERSNRVVAVEPEITREVIASAERNADECRSSLDRDVGYRRQRAVTPGHAERVGACRPSDLGRVLAFA